MADTTFRTRIKLRYDSYANWTTNNPTLMDGEVALAYIETPAATQEVGSVDNSASRQVLMKVGPGAYNDLQFISAKAADVHAWAKKTESEFTTWVKSLVSVEDIDLSAYYKKTEIDQQVATLNNADTNLQTQINTIKDGTSVDSFADVEAELAKKVDKVTGKSLIADSEITRLAAMSDGANKVESSATNGSIKIDGVDTVVYTHPANHTIAEVTGLQDALDTKANAANVYAKGETYSATEIDNKVAAINKANDDLGKRVEANEGALEVLNGDANTAGSVAKALADAKAYTNEEIEGIEIAIEKKDSVEHIIVKNKAGTEIASVDATAFVKDGMLTSAVYNKDTNKLTLTWNTDAGLQATDIDLNDLVDTYIGGNGINVATNGEISIDTGVVATVSALNEVKATAEAAQTAQEVSDAIDSKINALNLPNTYAAKEHEHTASEITDFESAVATKVESYDYATKAYADQAEADALKDAKAYADGLAKNYAEAQHTHAIGEVTGLQDALNTKANDADLAAIAKTGNVADLIQSSGDILIFDCGSSTVNV